MAAAAAVATPSAFDQKLLGPAYPAPSNLAAVSAIRDTAARLSSALQHALDSGQTPFGNFTARGTSLSLTASSARDAAPFLDFHYTSPLVDAAAGSTRRVTADTAYRVGTVSKLFTVYALLLNGDAAYWDRPVTDLVPELRGAAARPGADNVVERVVEHNNGDLSLQDFPWEAAGLPPLPPSAIPTCGGNTTQPPCSRKEYFEGFVQRHPVLPPYASLTYSNAAYRILGYAIEAMTGASYAVVLQRDVLGPLGLNQTSVSVPGGAGVGVVPPGDSGWAKPFGDEVPAGGLYSSPRDLAAFGRALLASKQLSPLATRRWMRPQAHTASLSAAVGAPWEIARTRSRVAGGYVVDLYTKSGGYGQYEALLVLVPALDAVFTMLAAGPDAGDVVGSVTEMALQAFLPVLDDVGQGQARERFCGTYAATNSSLVLAVDDAGPGLLVRQWTSNGADMLRALRAQSRALGGADIKSMRLYPTGLCAPGCRGPGEVAFRAVTEQLPRGYDASLPRVLDPKAGQRAMADGMVYGGVALGDFVFRVDGQGRAVGVEPRVLRQALQRVGGK
ncbi:Uncharacterized protein TPAR_03483 [Tolypocladium paradoxum]|uniref:Uncharacterized protein n=1 Tax=Tolypocladium paradoxum TaxID=94208 RepID=A0A2S4L1K3_9HYPO|nr:Uncharacterized protein TPAR_03483 [Tolypocladium paradoxum]